MKRELVITKDNSPTLFVPELDEHYHSIHGALAESLHVFIEAGLKSLGDKKEEVRILEMGFGTGLNAWLSQQEAEKLGLRISYHGLEKYPVSKEESMALGYVKGAENKGFQKLHETPWQVWNEITHGFSLYKDHVDLRNFRPLHNYDLIYFDAFAPSAQSELWTSDIFKSLFSCLEPGGVLVTYCVKGEVRRSMQAAGFQVEKIPGPPGKREMARAHKPLIPS